MRFEFFTKIALALVLVSVFAVQRADADIINLSSDGITGPGPDAGNLTAGPLTVSTSIGNVVFSGGAVATDLSNAPADEGTVYYTSSFCCGTGTTSETLTITFPVPIDNFFVDLYNGELSTETFTASDNNGETTTVSIPPNTSSGKALISFPATGSVVTITTTGAYDFFVDNIGFDQPTPGVPEPASVVLLGAGLVGLGWFRRRGISSR